MKDYKNEIPDNIIVPRLFVPKPEPNPCAKPCFPESPRTEEEEYDSSTKGGGIFKKKPIKHNIFAFFKEFFFGF